MGTHIYRIGAKDSPEGTLLERLPKALKGLDK